MVTLGQASNYRVGQVFRHLFAWGGRRDSERLRAELAERYGAQPDHVALYHTGRSALTVALQAAAAGKPCYVILPGLTCIAVVRAIKAAGCTPVFVDIELQTLEYNYRQLDAKLAELNRSTPVKSAPKSNDTANNQKTDDFPIDKTNDVCYNQSIILVQNTLGLSWDMSKIEKLAAKHHAIIVEDLAHSAGRFYPDGRETGTVGVATALSFGKGKAIDTIEGGAVILREATGLARPAASTASHSSASNTSPAAPLTQPTRLPSFADRLRDRWYPLFGLISRWNYRFGRYFIGGLVKLHFVRRSADAELDPTRRLTHWQAKLARRQLARLSQTPLRDFRLVKNRDEVLTKLAQQGYYLDEIWYDVPVSPRRYANEVAFPVDDCPQTIRIAREIINFPTWYPTAKLAPAYATVKPYEVKHESA